jgi:hypothetical protein
VENLSDAGGWDGGSLIVDDVDEGFHEDESLGDEGMETSLRRASMPSGIRKYNSLRYGRSADVVTIGGKIKVKCLPRMRRRKVPIVPE